MGVVRYLSHRVIGGVEKIAMLMIIQCLKRTKYLINVVAATAAVVERDKVMWGSLPVRMLFLGFLGCELSGEIDPPPFFFF